MYNNWAATTTLFCFGLGVLNIILDKPLNAIFFSIISLSYMILLIGQKNLRK